MLWEKPILQLLRWSATEHQTGYIHHTVSTLEGDPITCMYTDPEDPDGDCVSSSFGL